MKKSFNNLVAILFSLGFVCSAYSLPAKNHSQSQQAYTVASAKPGGGPRMPSPETVTGSTRLINLGDMQIN